MLEDPGEAGTANTALRPMIVLLNRPAFLVADSAVLARLVPYSVHMGSAPRAAGTPELWPLWGWRFPAVAGLLWALVSFSALGGMSPDAHRA
jgi:hypothetical protein